MTIYIWPESRLFSPLSVLLLVQVSLLLLATRSQGCRRDHGSLRFAASAGSLDPELAEIAEEYNNMAPQSDMIEDNSEDADDDDSDQTELSDETESDARKALLAKAEDAVRTLCKLEYGPVLLNVFKPNPVRQIPCSIKLNKHICNYGMKGYNLPSRCCIGKESNFMCPVDMRPNSTLAGTTTSTTEKPDD